MINYRWAAADSSKWWNGNLCSRLQGGIPNNWGWGWLNQLSWLSWEGGQVFIIILIVIIINLFLSQVWPWRQLPGFPSWPGHTQIFAQLHQFSHRPRRAGENILILSNSLSSVFQTGLACCWRSRQQLWRVINHRAVLPIIRWMGNRRKPSQVKIIFK